MAGPWESAKPRAQAPPRVRRGVERRRRLADADATLCGEDSSCAFLSLFLHSALFYSELTDPDVGKHRVAGGCPACRLSPSV